MAFCQECGAQVSGKFCPGCGANQSAEGGEPGASTNAPPSVPVKQKKKSVSSSSSSGGGKRGSLGGGFNPGPGDLREQLVTFYAQHNTGKTKSKSDITKIIKTYSGREDQLWADLCKQYGVTDHAMSQLPGIIEGLKRVYASKIRPLEETFKFDSFFSPLLTNTDFDARPMVLLVGQYSVGKTSFIRYMLERDFPGCRIGPEPTTDRFHAVMYGGDDRIIPGNALAAMTDKPFTSLTKFGVDFLNKLECSVLPSPILQRMTLIDTPGILSGEKQRIGRSYNFTSVVGWFADRADRILLLFDAHKLDISDEFKSAIVALKGNDDKIRVILNKADMVDKQSLMRVYGALMWSLGKVVQTPEVLRVYIGSFWDQPLAREDNADLFKSEQADLLADLRALPRNSAVRKVNELVKRGRLAKVHAHIINHLRAQFGWFGKDKKKTDLLKNLGSEFQQLSRLKDLPKGDFPSIPKFRQWLDTYDIHKFPKLDNAMLDKLDEALSIDIPLLMKKLPGESHYQSARGDGQEIGSGAPESNPFGDAGADDVGGSWAVSQADKVTFDNKFNALKLTATGKVSGANCKAVLAESGLETSQLRALWTLSDIDGDGYLDSLEFAVAMQLINMVTRGELTELPPSLPDNLVPPSKR